MEHAAKERGCTAAYLTTFSFQARPFYESLGYEVFGILDDYPPGYQKFSDSIGFRGNTPSC